MHVGDGISKEVKAGALYYSKLCMRDHCRDPTYTTMMMQPRRWIDWAHLVIWQTADACCAPGSITVALDSEVAPCGQLLGREGKV